MDSLLTLSEFKSFKDKLSFIISQPELDHLQLIFFSKKTVISSLGLAENFLVDYSEENVVSNGFEIIEKSKNNNNKIFLSFNFKSYQKGLYITINNNNTVIGAIFLPYKSNPTTISRNLILSLKYQIENQIKIKELEQKLISSNKELNNKSLEIESLIDVTEIINSQQGIKKDLFESLLITILSILNASKGMVLLKDEKSGFFNVISNFNLSKEELPNKIIRITKGILKELDVSKSSKIGNGTIVYPKACIQSESIIGKGVFLNTNCCVEHDSFINDFVHICPGSNLGGDVKIGKGSWVGIGSSIIQGIDIGKEVFIGAGSVVIRNLPNGVKAVGNPAQII